MTNTWIGTKSLESFLYDKNSLTDERLDIYKLPFQLKDKGEYVGDWVASISSSEET